VVTKFLATIFDRAVSFPLLHAWRRKRLPEVSVALGMDHWENRVVIMLRELALWALSPARPSLEVREDGMEPGSYKLP
jgi:hypothetical protein